MNSLRYTPLLKQKTLRGERGGVIISLLAFLLGIIVGLAGLFAGGYAFLTQLTIKDMISSTAGMLDVSIDYTTYISEEYAQKSVWNAVKDVATLVKNDEFSLNDVKDISPFVGEKISDTAETMRTETGIDMPVDGDDGLMNTPVSQLPTFFLDCLYDTDLGTLLSSPSVGMLDKTNSLYDFLMVLSYGEEGTDYTIVEEKVVMNEGKTPTKVGSLIGAEGYEAIAFDERIMSLHISSVVRFSSEENVPAFYKAIQNWTIGDLKNTEKINSLTLTDILGAESMEDNFILKNLKNSTMQTINDDIANLTVLDVFGDQAYENGTLKGTWKYMLKDEHGDVIDYKISEFDQLVSNMQRNMQNASLNELSGDGIAVVENDTLNTQILYEFNGSALADRTAFNDKTTIGELTIIELGNYIGTVIGALNALSH